MNQTTTVTLVHGTFARRAEWTRPGSRMWRALESAGATRIVRFEWSGRNSYSARERASARLAEYIIAEKQREPSGRHVLVCHSHGGNIAVRAVAAVPGDYVAAIVCLGTPFLVGNDSESDRLESVTRWLVNGLVGLPGALLMGFAGLFLLIMVLIGDPGWSIMLGSGAAIGVGAWLQWRAQSIARLWLERYLASRAAMMGRWLRIPEHTSTLLTAVQTRRDEAGLLLRAFESIDRSFRVLWEALARALVFLYGPLMITAFGLGALSFFITLPDLLITVAGTALLVLIWGFALVGAILPVAMLAPLSRSHPAAFGWEGIVVHQLVRIRVHRDGGEWWPGPTESHEVPVPSGQGRLRHSRLYSDERVIQIASDVVRTTAASRAESDVEPG